MRTVLFSPRQRRSAQASTSDLVVCIVAAAVLLAGSGSGAGLAQDVAQCERYAGGYEEGVGPLTRVRGTPGNDTLVGTAASELFLAGEGNDTIDAAEGGLDIICAGEGDDRIGGGGTVDIVVADAGDDGISGVPAPPGADYRATLIIDFEFAPRRVVVDLAAGTASGWGADKLSGVASVFGSRYGDSLRGDRETNALAGRTGDDQLFGAGEEDSLSGGSGNDTIDGGPGFDYIDYSSAKRRVKLDLLRGTATGEGADRVRSVEWIEATRFADVIVGDNDREFVFASGGKDVVVGHGGADQLGGGPGNDNVGGGAGNDRIYGERGNDKLDGGPGRDTVHGGPGVDRCRRAEVRSSCP
jgi:Ca2+-binding RTX toxin-like protein